MQSREVVCEMLNMDTGRSERPKIVKQGYLRKLKTMRKKYFVLKEETPENAARLEYYDSEKKFKSNGQPKRVIPLNSCYNIARRLDTRHKHLIGLYTKDECICLVLDGEEELESWLRTLQALLHGESAGDDKPHPRQHVWQVNVQKRGLGASTKILGLYNLCLTDKTVSLVKIRHNITPLPPDTRAADTIEFSLPTIRRCGDCEAFFFMDVGRSSVVGAGELWMLTEDPNIAQNMHTTIYHAMKICNKDPSEEINPETRTRSSSATEASRPISLTRRQTHSGVKSHGMSPSSESAFCGSHMCVGSCIAQCGAESAAYCAPVVDSGTESPAPREEAAAAAVAGSPLARKIDENRTLIVAHERTRSLPLTGEENTDVLTNMNGRHLLEAASRHQEAKVGVPNGSHCPTNGALHPKSHHFGGGGRRASTGCHFVKWSPSRCSVTGVSIRERCDSLPSRANFLPASGSSIRPSSNSISGHQVSRPLNSALRPHSIHTHNISHSPPVSMNTALSPYTDSAGSSLSMDETDNAMHLNLANDDTPHIIARLLNSRTPDERMIPEEVETFSTWQPEKSLIEKLEKTILSHTEPQKESTTRKMSFTGNLDMNSPISVHATSPTDSGGYMPMSPAGTEPLSKMIHSRTSITSANHSRTSSLADDILHGDVHPPIPPTSDDGYVDMEPQKDHSSHHTMSPAGSICSVTSGTPSNDLRFSEFHLEKVTSYFSPSEEDEENRPARAYSVGSRPDHVQKIIARPEVQNSIHSNSESARTRAFSVGSRSKNHKDNRILNHGTPPHHNFHHLITTTQGGSKSSSAPILAGVHHHIGTPSRHAYNSSHSSVEPLDDLMELDFTKRSDSISSVKSKTNTGIPHSTSRSSQLSLGVPTSTVQTTNSSRCNDEGYMDMSPVGMANTGYVEMKPAEHSGSLPKVIPDNANRKSSIAKSPSETISEVIPSSESFSLSIPQSATPEGYVEMSWNGKVPNRTRISSLPIAINTSVSKELSQVTSSASPIFSMTSLLKGDNGGAHENKNQDASQKLSPGVLPNVPVTTSPVSSLKRNSKKYHQLRRNSKEFQPPINVQSQPAYTFALNSPGSLIKPLLSRQDANMPNRKCSVDASSGTIKLSNSEENVLNASFTLTEKTINCSLNEGSDYMEMTPGRLSTVKEINEPLSNKSGVDKDTKQMLNNATKVSGSTVPAADYCDYIILNPNSTVNTNKSKSNWFKTQKSVDDSISTKNKTPNGSQPISAPKGQNNLRKISMPSFVNLGLKSSDGNAKENQGILSSNPLANKSFMSNPLTKSNTNVTNQKQQTVKKPIVVLSQPQQPITANFKPITASEVSELRNAKSGSPKPIESVLNRQLAGALCDNKSKNGGSSNDPSDFTSGSTNGKQSANRSNSLNKCKKINNSSSRPPSVTSELSSGGTVRSRPSSVSSEMSGTPTNSRPASVTSEREGVPVAAITAGRGLHYASLELDAPSERSPRPPVTPVASHPPNFTYAQIDFVKSEELKNSKNLSAKSKN